MTVLMTTEHAGIRQHARRWPTTVAAVDSRWARSRPVD
jgi:hypothetical protein